MGGITGKGVVASVRFGEFAAGCGPGGPNQPAGPSEPSNSQQPLLVNHTSPRIVNGIGQYAAG